MCQKPRLFRPDAYLPLLPRPQPLLPGLLVRDANFDAGEERAQVRDGQAAAHGAHLGLVLKRSVVIFKNKNTLCSKTRGVNKMVTKVGAKNSFKKTR